MRFETKRPPAAGGGCNWIVSIRTLILVTLLVYVGSMLYIISQSNPPKRNGSSLYTEYQVLKLQNEQLEKEERRSREPVEPPVSEFDSPIVVTGTAGTGTRVANDILEHAGGVFMGLHRNEQRDSATFDFLVKRYVEEILRLTEGKLDYEIDELPTELVTKIRKGIDEFAEIMERDAKANSKTGRWGWKESQAMFFMPFLYAKWPHLRFVHVLRDGRDVAFSKQQRARFQEGYVRIVTKTTAPMNTDDYAKAVIKTWQRINLTVAGWMRHNQIARYFMIRLEDMCGKNSKTYASKLLTEVLGLKNAEKNPAATVNTGECRIGKWKARSPELVKELQEIAKDGLNFFDYHLEDENTVHDHPEDTIESKPDKNKIVDESDSPIVVTGTAGTGTRVANDILEHSGKVYMGGRRNKERDSTEFDDYVKRYVDDVLTVTGGNLNYAIEDIPDHLAQKIRNGIETFDSIMRKELSQAENGRWGWKESQAMFFFPFLYEKYPKLRVVHVVRDGRDIAFSKQQRMMYQEKYVRSVTKTVAAMTSDEYAKAVITTWQIINLSSTRWLEDNRTPQEYLVVRLEDMCGDNKEATAAKMLSHVLGITNQPDPAKTVATDKCRLLKYLERDTKLVEELTSIANKALDKFGYLAKPKETPEDKQDTAEPWQSLNFKDLVNLQASKSSTGQKEVVLLVTDSKYKSVFLNWLILAEHHNVRNYLMIALNSEMHEFCKEIGFPSYFFKDKFSSQMLVGDIWAARVKIIIDILEMGVGVHMVDSDAFYLQNPYPFMHPELYDIEALAGDFPWSVSWPTGKIGTVNGGFVRINPNPVAITFIKNVLKHMHQSHIADDQHSINHLLDDMGIQWTPQPGCLHNFGLCHTGNTTKNTIFNDVQKGATLKVRLLDKPHFPVLASWKRHECNLKFYLLQESSEISEEERIKNYYYTPMVVHPAGSPKEGKAKIQFFQTNQLWFLTDSYADVTLQRRKDQGLNVEYVHAIRSEAMIQRIEEMAAFSAQKRKGEYKENLKCW